MDIQLSVESVARAAEMVPMEGLLLWSMLDLAELHRRAVRPMWEQAEHQELVAPVLETEARQRVDLAQTELVALQFRP